MMMWRPLKTLLSFVLPTWFSDTTIESDTQNVNANAINKIPNITIGHDFHGFPVQLPLVGAGTGHFNDTIAYESVCKAFRAGYTMVDTAYIYQNQRGVGRAIRDCWNSSRQELFVLTKIPGGLTTQQALLAFGHDLHELQLEYVDHLMIHYPSDWNQTSASPEQRQEEWRALENIYMSGKARSIGVSHYCERHLDDILEMATIIPSLNQIEYHVGSGDVDQVLQKCRDSNITFMSFSPLCGPCTYNEKDSLIHGELVTRIGGHYNVSGSQVSLRYIVQQALEQPFMAGVVPRSNTETHIRSNIDLFSFHLSKQHMEELKAAKQPAAKSGDCSVP